jgi:hypothetical protein
MTLNHSALDAEDANMQPILTKARSDSLSLLQWLIPETEKRYPGSYAGNIFKNRDRYSELEADYNAFSGSSLAEDGSQPRLL